MPIYLDTCCLNRPYDDQSQPRIQLEAAAVLAILQRVASGEIQLANSSVLLFEIHRIVDPTRRNGILHFLSYSSSFQRFSFQRFSFCPMFSVLIRHGLPQSARLATLNDIAITPMRTLLSTTSAKRLR